jgi:hypothetical protein
VPVVHDTEATSSKRKYDSAIDTSCAFETNDLNLTTANFDSYGNVSFDPCEFTLHTAANADYRIKFTKTSTKFLY